MKRFTNTVLISYDSDDAGIKAALRNSQILEKLDLDVFLIQIPKPHDPDSFILQFGKGAYLQLIKEKISSLEYQLAQFSAQGPNASVEAKNEIIDELLESILTIPNDIKVGLFIHQIAEKLEIAESMVISQFNKLKRRRRFQPKIGAEEKEAPSKKQIYRKGKWQAEEGIIALLLSNQDEAAKQIFDQISVSDFENDDLRTLFELITLKWEEHGAIDFNDLNNALESVEDKSMLARLSMLETSNPEKFAADCIYQIRKWHLDSRFNELKRLMHEESSSPESVMHYMKEMSSIRNKLTEIENERTKYQKL